MLTGGVPMTKQQITEAIIKKSEKIAEEIKRGKDIEIKTSSSGLKWAFFYFVERSVRFGI